MTKTSKPLRISRRPPQPINEGTAASWDISVTNDVPNVRHALIRHLRWLHQIDGNEQQIETAVDVAAELINNATDAKRILARLIQRGRNPDQLAGIALSHARLKVGVIDEEKAFRGGFIIDDERSLAANGLVVAVTDHLPTDLSLTLDLTPLDYFALATREEGKGLYEIGVTTHNISCFRYNAASKIVSTVVPSVPFFPEIQI